MATTITQYNNYIMATTTQCLRNGDNDDTTPTMQRNTDEDDATTTVTQRGLRNGAEPTRQRHANATAMTTTQH
jgi:hypothetical protein